MRIAYVTETYPPEINGVALTVERSVRHLRRHGHEVTLMRPRQPGEPAQDDEREWRTRGMPIPLYPDLRLGLATTGGLIQRFLRESPQLVHVATQGPLGRAALNAARTLGVPVTTDFRTNFHWYSRYYRLGAIERIVWRYLRGFHRLADRTFVPTRAMRDELTRQGIPRVEVAGRGVDAQRFTPGRRSAALRASWGVTDDDERVLLYVGRLAAEKQVSLALEAYEALRARRPQTAMVVAGDGPLRARLQRRHPTAHFVGVQRAEALAEHYASADLFLFPSQSETYGNVTVEALASGLAVVAFDCAAASELIRDGESGFLVPSQRPEVFADTVERAMACTRLLPMRMRARELALGMGWERVLTDWEAQLCRLALQPRSTAGAQTAMA